MRETGKEDKGIARDGLTDLGLPVLTWPQGSCVTPDADARSLKHPLQPVDIARTFSGVRDKDVSPAVHRACSQAVHRDQTPAAAGERAVPVSTVRGPDRGIDQACR